MTDGITNTDVLIIGAGPAGTVAAALLRKKGHDCIILERGTFPRFSIGESLLPQCMEFLEEADMLGSVRAQRFQDKVGAVFSWDGALSGFDFREQFSSGAWSETFEVQRATFDQTLAMRAEELGVRILFAHTVQSVDSVVGACSVVATDGDKVERRFRAKFILDASGFGRVLPRLLDLDAPSDFPVRRSLFTHIEDRIGNAEFERDKILITIHPEHADIWYWLIPFSNGRSSVGVVAAQERFAHVDADPGYALRALIDADPRLNAYLNDAVFDTPVNQITGYGVNVKRLWGDGFALLGNAGEFLDPVFSSGVTIAMKSASLAAAALDRQLSGQVVDWDAEFAKPLMFGVDVFRAFVESWYDGVLHGIIFGASKDERIKSMICSILAGYVWDERNPYVFRTRPKLLALAETLRARGDTPYSARLPGALL